MDLKSWKSQCRVHRIKLLSRVVEVWSLGSSRAGHLGLLFCSVVRKATSSPIKLFLGQAYSNNLPSVKFTE